MPFITYLYVLCGLLFVCAITVLTLLVLFYMENVTLIDIPPDKKITTVGWILIGTQSASALLAAGLIILTNMNARSLSR